MNQLLTHESKSIDTAMQSLKKANNWLSSFIESYSPPLDGERYLTDKELSELLKLSRRTLQEYRKQGIFALHYIMWQDPLSRIRDPVPPHHQLPQADN